MIVTDRRTWLRQVFMFKGTTLTVIWKRVAVSTAVAIAVTVAYQHIEEFRPNLTHLPFTLIGLALSIFLGFRNNACYDRWWEARKLWGRLINTSRSFTRQALTMVDDAAVQKELAFRTIAFVHALRLHLREQLERLDELKAFLPADEVERLKTESNVPTAILQGTADRLKAARGSYEPVHLLALDGSLTDFSDIQGGCERIKNTPVPLSYTMLTHRIVMVYCATLPLGLIDTVGPFTPVAVLIIAYAFLGLDSVGSFPSRV